MYLLANRKQAVDPDKEAQLMSYIKSSFNRADSFHTYMKGQDVGLEKSWLVHWMTFSYKCKRVTESSWFSNFITAVIVLASTLVGMQTYPSMEYVPGEDDNTTISRVLNVMDQIILYIFTFEVILKIVAEGSAPWRYLFINKESPEEEKAGSRLADPDALGSMWNVSKSYRGFGKEAQRKARSARGCWEKMMNYKIDFWNLFDFSVVVVCYLPLGADMVAVIRLFRLLRVLKLVKALPELQVLVAGLLGSLTSIFYVAVLLFLVFYLYAILCVTLLRQNDPVHFSDLQTAFMTLFRMATLEDWTDIMYTAMLGCDVYGYNFATRQHLCEPGYAMGWIAAPMFVSFTVMATFVVLNLFIGVINENMQLAKEQLKEMKKNEDARKLAGDDTARDMVKLRLLSKQTKKLAKRAARLHQGLAMCEYDIRMLVVSMEKKSALYEVNQENFTVTKRHRRKGIGRAASAETEPEYPSTPVAQDTRTPDV